jgi:KipI family sensor histidine kinase inhibitor
MALGRMTAPVISLLGTSALLLEAPGETGIATQRRIWSLARDVADWPETGEAVPGMNNLMLRFIAPPRRLDAIIDRLLAAWEAAEPMALDGRLVELQVAYGGDGGQHLADVLRHTGLGIDELVSLHTAPEYIVYALGSHPGYCYLDGMDPRLTTPRRKVPVLSLPGGTVSIGGSQTGVSASTGPSGWNTIGTTSARFFDPGRDPPALLGPGDRLRLHAAKVIR